ncbi:MAG: transcriptional repressor [Saprospiraceae bacterium]|nr:transcriptional repressor [Saprospiraceae bacterium]
MKEINLVEKVKSKKLKVTPQRVAILEAIYMLDNHPTAENIIQYIGKNYPNIAVGTVYKVLESFVDNGLLNRVKTENDVMRYDPMVENHHHLYCCESDKIENFEDPELDHLIAEHFRKKKIKNFKIKDIKLQITGIFKNK